MMQRYFAKLGRPLLSSSPCRLLLFSPNPLPLHPLFSIRSMNFSSTARIIICRSGLLRPHSSSFLPAHVFQSRHFATKKMERSRAPDTPVISKVKKYKLKTYSSFKFRFRTMHDGQIRRWRAGKRHNAHLKASSGGDGSSHIVWWPTAPAASQFMNCNALQISMFGVNMSMCAGVPYLNYCLVNRIKLHFQAPQPFYLLLRWINSVWFLIFQFFVLDQLLSNLVAP